MLRVDEALRIVLARARPLETETVGLAVAAGRVLRETIRADRDLPPFDRAQVDGYAVRAASLAGGGGRLRIVDRIAAGQWPGRPVGDGEAVAIMTGAPIPDGADAAIMIEDTVREGEFVRWPAPGRTPSPVAPGQRVTRRAAEVRAGTPLLEEGERLSAAGIGLLATVGKIRVRVGRRPTAAVLSTGDELVHPRTRTPGPAAIRDANSHLIAARCRALGLPVRRLAFVRDDPRRLGAAISRGLAAEVLFISGGISMGRFDFVEQVLEEQGVRRLVTSVAIRPGKPFVFGVAEAGGVRAGRGTLVFGLPGNPVSALTTFEVFARPALDRLEGMADPGQPRLRVRLLSPVSKRGPRRGFLPARVTAAEDGELLAHPVRSQGSADIAAVALANALLIVPEERGEVGAGETLLARPLSGFPDPAPRWQDPRR